LSVQAVIVEPLNVSPISNTEKPTQKKPGQKALYSMFTRRLPILTARLFNHLRTCSECTVSTCKQGHIVMLVYQRLISQ
jgi:hypothetical protein